MRAFDASRTPSLPKEMNERSNFRALLGCLFTFALWLVPCVTVGALWSSSLPLGLKIALALPLGLVGAYGVLLTGFMGHDGTHFNLHENKVVSSMMGIVMTSPVIPYFLMGFTISHWNHHKHTNTELDPDSEVFSKFRNFFSRALLARPYSFYEYGTNTFRLALGRPLRFQYNFPLSDEIVRRLAWFNIFCNVSMAILLACVAWQAPIYAGAVLYVFLCGSVVSGLSPYIEHDGTDLGRGIDTRTSVGAWWDFFMLGNNYHLEHHLYPTVPFYNLKRAYRYLRSVGFYDQPRHVSSGILGTYKYTLSPYPYPNARARGR